MKLLCFISSYLMVQLALADVAFPIVCRGSNVTLTVTETWFGDDTQAQKWVQKLYTIRESDTDFVAYFLNVQPEGSAGSAHYIGQNEIGGNFILTIPGTEQNHGDIYTPNAKGFLTYQHGPIHGENISVICSAEE